MAGGAQYETLCREQRERFYPEVVAGSAKDNATNWTIFVLVAAFGGCFVGFLLFFLATRFVQYQQERQHEADSSSPVAEDVQTSRAGDSTAIQAFYNSLHPTMNAELVKDPVIASFRLKYKDLHVGRCISKGGFGLVYMGMYKHRRVAIKKIMREKCEKLSQIRMFIREITLMGSLKHDHVLHILKHRESNIDHELTWQGTKLTIALHIAEGLAYMHSLNPKVIHRDLKSKNVLLNNAYEAKLSDFGVSRERQVADVAGGPGRFMTPGVGTSFWIAPEVLLGRDYDERADIFSFGIVLSEIDTDDYPYWNSAVSKEGQKTDPALQRLYSRSKSSCEMQFDSKPRLEPEPDEIVTDGFLSSA
ncbi:Protein kinase-like domain [Phytophthora cactorum]|nr:Protein kinase-like domain [Phytophthora cactorum]